MKRIRRADAAPSSALLSFAPEPRERVQTQLRVGDLRLRLDVSMREPHVTLLGFEDSPVRLIQTPPLSDTEVSGLVRAFEGHMNLLRR